MSGGVRPVDDDRHVFWPLTYGVSRRACRGGRDLRADILTDVRSFIFVRIDCLLGNIGGAFEVEFVSIRIGEDGNPHVVADEGAARLEIAGESLAIDGESVFALEADGDAFP